MEKLGMKNQSTIQIKSLLWSAALNLTFLSMSLALENQTDRFTLLAIKDQLLSGSSPSALLSWNDSLHFCDWQGVRCDQQRQRVTSLRLIGMELGGSISPSIGNLSFLIEANISDSCLQGSIPKEFGQLKQLRFLNLSHNNLQGNIPIELTNCSNLQMINFNYNNLTGRIPFQFGDSIHMMKNLSRLSLSRNNLVGGLPSSLGNLSSLNYLQLGDNHLDGNIPKELGRITNLSILVLRNNNLSGNLPTAIYNLSLLTYIAMPGNQLSGSLAPEFGFSFPKLEILHIGNNQFIGTVPSSITNISTLKEFDIALNGFSGQVPNNMGNFPNLQLLSMNYNNLGSGKAGDLDFLSSLTNSSLLTVLAIHRNRLSGMLPESISNLSIQLDLLYVGENLISGSIPEGIGNLVKLNLFDIGGNFLTGNIPSSIGKLRNLQRFDLSLNRLSGKIPSSIGNLSVLYYLNLSSNQLEGRFPGVLKTCKHMQFLDLSQNKLNDSIPEQLIGAFESLITLNLSYNLFIGPLPSDIGNIQNLVELYVDNNNFSGEIPSSVGQISGLRILYMQRNYFEGSIPASFGLLVGLDKLDLSGNNLSGKIPSELQKLQFLVSLNLSSNQLEGQVPGEGVFKNTSRFSIVGNTKLCGGIPELKLPKCFNQEAKKRGNALSTKVIVATTLSISVALILLLILAFICWRRVHSRKEALPVTLLGENLRVSYKDLLEATNGFATYNLLGEGSFGSVFKGILHEKERPVAIKVLNLQNLGAARTFTVECEALSKVLHRNLVKVITSCSSITYQGDDFKALVLQFMPNGSLESWLHPQQHESHHLNFDQMLDIAIDVANALDYLHHHCETVIVHRDLKPTNVLLDDDMVAHVSDFGMAKVLSGDANYVTKEQTTSSVIKGTIGYLAPEYGMGGLASPAGDIYSYGVLLLEMITRKRPTDHLFHDGVSLHNFCKVALPDQLEEILDFRLLEQINEKGMKIKDEIPDCFVSFARVGVACSEEVPSERMKIEDAIAQLHAIKAKIAWRLIH